MRDEDNRLWYEIHIPGKEVRYIRREDTIHIPALGANGVMGIGLLTVAREAIGLNSAQDQYAGKFFRNGGNISGVIETANSLKEDAFQRLKKEVAEKFGGLTNAHRVAILENGLNFKSINPTHQEAQLIEARRFSVEEWARWLNMPPHKLKEMTHATFSNVEHQNIEWVVDSIRPWLVRSEQEYDRKLLRKTNQFYFKHVVDGLLRGDQQGRYAAYAVARNWGWFSANDVLELEDRNPLPGDTGDIYLIPANMQRADQPLAPQQKAAEQIVKQEQKSLTARGAAGTYDDGFQNRLMALMNVPRETAKRYVSLTQQLNLMADEKDIPDTQRQAMKASLLVQMANGGMTHAQI
jgi:phage portal protein BeeE